MLSDLQILYIYIVRTRPPPAGRNGSAVSVAGGRGVPCRCPALPRATFPPPASFFSSLFVRGLAPACAGIVPACRADIGKRPCPCSIASYSEALVFFLSPASAFLLLNGYGVNAKVLYLLILFKCVLYAVKEKD